MNYDEISALVQNGYSTHGIAHALHTSQTNVRYWLNHFGLQTDRAKLKGRYRCKCGEVDPAKYYGHKRTMCARCDSAYTVERQRKMAQRVRSHLGGKCVYCNYKRFQVALELHHIDPTNKDPTFRCFRGWTWQRVLKEIEKCVLACSNCHTAVHAGLLPFTPKSR